MNSEREVKTDVVSGRGGGQAEIAAKMLTSLCCCCWLLVVQGLSNVRVRVRRQHKLTLIDQSRHSLS